MWLVPTMYLSVLWTYTRLPWCLPLRNSGVSFLGDARSRCCCIFQALRGDVCHARLKKMEKERLQDAAGENLDKEAKKKKSKSK